jgi:hypothetical protein
MSYRRPRASAVVVLQFKTALLMVERKTGKRKPGTKTETKTGRKTGDRRNVRKACCYSST